MSFKRDSCHFSNPPVLLVEVEGARALFNRIPVLIVFEHDVRELGILVADTRLLDAFTSLTTTSSTNEQQQADSTFFIARPAVMYAVFRIDSNRFKKNLFSIDL